MYCLHPACYITEPHKHFFTSEWCKEDVHLRCKGYSAVTLPSVLAEEDIIKKHRQQMDELFAEANGEPGRDEVWQMNEHHRREWERFVDARSKATRMVTKVWTCDCECHEHRSALVAGSVSLQQRIAPWYLAQFKGRT